MKNILQLTTILLLLCSPLVVADRPVVNNANSESMTLDQAFESLSVYQHGQSRQPVRFIERSVYLASDKPGQRAAMTSRLLKVIQSPKSTLPAKQLACKWIVLVDDSKGISILASMLKQNETFEMALGALELYESHVADEAILRALNSFKGSKQIAVINALGRRGNEASIDQLAVLLKNKDPEVAKAATVNLGIIGSENAAQRLMQADIISKEVIHDALLRCAAKLRQSGNDKAALEVYSYLWKQKSPAGLIGLVSIQKQNARGEILEAINSDSKYLANTAINLAGTLSDSSIDKELINLLGEVSSENKIALIRMFAANRKTGANEAIASEFSCEEDDVVIAAVEALGQLGDESSVEPLAMLASTKTGAVGRAARESLVLLGGSRVDSTITKKIQTGKSQIRGELIQAAVKRNIPLSSSDLWKIIKNSKEPIDARKGAISALAVKSKANDYQQLIAFWSKLDELSLSPSVKMAVLKLGMQMDDTVRCEPLLTALKGELDPKVLGQMLGVAGYYDHPELLTVMRSSLASDETQVQLEAVRALATWPADKGIDELKKVASQSNAKTQRVIAQRALLVRGESKELPVGVRLGMLETLAKSDAADSLKQQGSAMHEILKQELPGYRIEQLEKNAPAGFSVAAYLNCGTDIIVGGDGELSLKLTKGGKFQWAGSEKKTPARAGTVFFDGSEVVFNAKGLKKGHSYALGFVWVDYDRQNRVQLVQADDLNILAGTKLPSSYSKEQPLPNMSAAIPAGVTADGKCVIRFQKQAGVNAVVSEVWLYESKGITRKMSKDAKQILLVTGEDYPGHKWQETTPVLHSLLEKDGTLNVEVLDDLTKLAGKDLKPYDAVVMHFKNYDPKVPGRDGYDNLSSYVKNGGGLVLVHFACGAFQEFKDEFTVLAGRAWNPKLRGHDPHGKFTVNIIDHEHPVTKGMKDFETVDELYTCLDGNPEIHVIAESVSKVDNKKYPMAFVLKFGKGKVFHSVLGHDTVAFEPDAVGELYRRATEWVAK